MMPSLAHDVVRAPSRRAKILITEDLRDLRVEGGWESKLRSAVSAVGFTSEFWDVSDATVHPDVAGILVNAPTISAEVLDRIPNLAMIVRFGSGLDNIDRDECARRTIAVRNIPGPIAVEMAGAISGLILSKLFDVRGKETSFLAHGWNSRRSVTAVGAAGATVGLIGAGRIGARIASALHALGIGVLFASSSVSAADGAHIGEKRELNELCQLSDVVVVLSPLRGDTRGLVGAEQIALMGRNSHLIAMSRGGVVDEAAALHAVKRGAIGSVHLDVFEGEPAVPEPYSSMPGLTVTPHNLAWSGTFFHETLRQAVALFREALVVSPAEGGAS